MKISNDNFVRVQSIIENAVIDNHKELVTFTFQTGHTLSVPTYLISRVRLRVRKLMEAVKTEQNLCAHTDTAKWLGMHNEKLQKLVARRAEARASRKWTLHCYCQRRIVETNVSLQFFKALTDL